MKTENLTKAYHSAQFVAREIREAHTDAVNSENQFAEIALFDLIEASVKLEQKLKRLVDAAADRATCGTGGAVSTRKRTTAARYPMTRKSATSKSNSGR